MKPPDLEIITTGDGLRQMRMRVGNGEWTATERSDGWELEAVSPGPFTGGLAHAVAQELLQQLARLVKSAKRPTVPLPRAACPLCGKPSVAISREKFCWHLEGEPRLDVKQVLCRAVGLTLAEAEKLQSATP